MAPPWAGCLWTLSLRCVLHGRVVAEGEVFATNPSWHPGPAHSAGLSLSLVLVLPFPSLSCCLITSWRGTWNTLEVVDLAEALACGTGNASGDGTPRPWAALRRACICRDGNALESQSPGPCSAGVRPWDLRRSHLPATIHGACPGSVGLRHHLDLPLPPPGQLPPHCFCPEGVWAGKKLGHFPLTFSAPAGLGEQGCVSLTVSELPQPPGPTRYTFTAPASTGAQPLGHCHPACPPAGVTSYSCSSQEPRCPHWFSHHPQR